MKLSKPELDVGVTTRDVKSATAFYRDLLGLQELRPISMGSLGEQSRLRVGNHTLELYDFARSPGACVGGTDRANGMRLLACTLDDLDAVLACFRSRLTAANSM